MLLVDISIVSRVDGDIPIQCEFCEKIVLKPKTQARKKLKYCSPVCYKLAVGALPPREVVCRKCNKKFVRSNYSIKNSDYVFCSRRCSASFFNKENPKRKRIEKVRKCKSCQETTQSRHKFCHSCKEKGKHFKFGKPTGEVELEVFLVRKKDASRFAAIRTHARSVTKKREQVCKKCGYDKHVETCHIRAITDFNPKTKVKQINHPNNLILLCPNCHWELDNLKAPPARIERA